jgi:serine/threonine-protein kinase RsbW
MSDRIELAIPAQPEFLRLVRLASADVGSRAGLDFEEIDDLKIAVSEACSLLLGGDAAVRLEFEFDDGRVDVEGASAGAADVDRTLSLAIIGAVVDEHDLTVDGDRTHFRLVKRHRA